MVLAQATWAEVRDFGTEGVVLIPTGSLEQHGPALPLFTDSVLVTAVAEAVEARMPDRLLLTPTLWLGASTHHLAFSGTLSASFEAYQAALESVVESLLPHGFSKFYVLNGHGGNTEPNGVTLRRLRHRYPEALFGHSGYFAFIAPEVLATTLEGPLKEIRHACEAETSLMLHVRPEWVREDQVRDDGLKLVPPVRGMVLHFDEVTEAGALGYPSYATAEKGEALFRAAVDGAVRELSVLAGGLTLRGPL